MQKNRRPNGIHPLSSMPTHRRKRLLAVGLLAPMHQSLDLGDVFGSSATPLHWEIGLEPAHITRGSSRAHLTYVELGCPPFSQQANGFAGFACRRHCCAHKSKAKRGNRGNGQSRSARRSVAVGSQTNRTMASYYGQHAQTHSQSAAAAIAQVSPLYTPISTITILGSPPLRRPATA